jgi:hypothetical protein
MAELPVDDARTLVRAVVALAEMADRALPPRVDPLSGRLGTHLGLSEGVIPNTSATFETIERASLQVALDHLGAESESWDVIGLNPDIGNYGGVSLPGMVSGSWRGPGEAAREYEAVEIGPGETISCLRAGIMLGRFDGQPVAVMAYRIERGRPQVRLEVVAVTQDAADALLRRVRALMDEHDVLRGKVLTFDFGEYGEFGLTFAALPAVGRDAVILPPGHLEAIEEHALGIGESREALLAAGQHVKRGLLLYGPPGTGKTHTISYLLGRTPDRTTVILSGASVHAVGQAGTIARKLQPATIVIEDVDLIGMDRGLPGGEHNAVLFQLLNEMDGLEGDVDVLFVLTTNRPELLEPALAARPGRIDQAVEIPLPDAAGRRALFELYLGDPVDDGVVAEAVERTEGVAAAFIKELARRATLKRIRHDMDPAAALRQALDDMVEQSSPLLRSALAGSRTADPPVIPSGRWTRHPGGR